MTKVVVGNLIAKLGLDSKEFKDGIKTATNETKKFTTDLKEVSKVSKDSLHINTQPFTDGINTAGDSLDGLKNKLSKIGSDVKGAFAGVGDSIGAALCNPITAALAVIGGAVTTAKSAFESAEKMQEGTNKLRIGTGATGEQLDAMSASMKDIYGGSVFEIDDISSAMADLNTAYSIQGEELETLTDKYLKFAKLTGGDVTTSIADAREMFNKFGVDVKDQADYLDYIFSLSQKSGAKTEDIINIASQYDDAFQMIGMSARDATAMIANAVKVNGKEGASDLMAGVNKAIMEASKQVTEEGGDNMQFIKDIQKFFTDVTNGDIKGNTMDLIKQAGQMFGERNAQSVVNALQAGVFDYESLNADALENGDTLDQAMKDTETMGDKFTKLQHKVMGGMAVLGEKIGSALLPVLEFMTEKLEAVFGWFSGIFNNPAIQEGLSAIWEALSKVAQAIFGTGENSEELDTFFKVLSDTIVNILVPILNTIADIITNVVVPAIGILKEWVSTVFNFITDRITGTLDAIDGFYNGTLDTIENLVNGVLNFFGDMWNGLVKMAQGAVDAIMSIPGIEQALGFVGVGKVDLSDKLVEPSDVKIGRYTGLSDTSQTIKNAQNTVNQTVNIQTTKDIDALQAQRGIEKANKNAFNAIM